MIKHQLKTLHKLNIKHQYNQTNKTSI